MTTDTLTIGSFTRDINPRTASFLLAITMFCTGAAGLVNEYVLATVSTYVLGNSVEQFSVVIATMLLAMGAGSWAQRFVSDDSLVEKFIGIELALTLIGSFAPTIMYGSFAYVEDHFPLVQYFLIVSIGFLVGFEIPIVVRLNGKFSENLRTNIATIYGLDYLGAFVAALLWSKFLIKEFPLTETSFIVSGCNLFVAVSTYLYFAKCGWVKHAKLIAIGIVSSMLLLGFGFSQNRDWNEKFEQKMYADPIVKAETTKYQRIVVTRNNKLGDYRLYLNGNLQFSSTDEKRYHESLVHPALSSHPNPKRVLVLGGGDGLAIREILKYASVESLTLVDLDPGMIGLAKTDPILSKLNGGAFSDARVISHLAPVTELGTRTLTISDHIHAPSDRRKARKRLSENEPYANVTVVTMDADRFVREMSNSEPFDVILSDLPDPNSIELAKLYSREFYRGIRSLLSENGLFVVQATSPYHAKEAFLCIDRTIGSSGWKTLPYHVNIPSFGDWGWIIAWKETGIPPELKNIKIKVPTNYITTETVAASMVFGKGELDSKNWEINTRMRPVLLSYYTEGWQID
jgi:spermidine synthase